MRITITVNDINEELEGRIVPLDYSFFYDGNILSLEGSCWRKEVPNPEKVFDSIKSFFYGTRYRIANFEFHKK